MTVLNAAQNSTSNAITHKIPVKAVPKKIQLQDGHADYSTFLLYIRKAWENHLNGFNASFTKICWASDK